MKKRIILFTNHLTNSSNLRTVISWSKALTNANYAVTILTYYPDSNEPSFDTRITRANLVSSYQAYTELSYKRVACKKLLEQYLNEHPQDILIPLTVNCNLLAAIASCSVQILTQTQLNRTDDPKQKFEFALNDWAIQKQGSVIVQTEEQLEHFNTPLFKHVKKYIAHSPLLNSEIKNIQKDDYKSIKKIITIGRLTREKNHQLMIEALRILRDEYHENYNLDIYGEGELFNELQTQIKKYHLEQQIKIYPNMKTIQSIVSYDLFLSASAFNGIHKTLLEAMSFGLPSLAIRTSVIKNGHNGYTINCYNAHTLAKKIHKINHPETLAIIGKQARQNILAHYTIDKLQSELTYIIEDLLRHKPKRYKASIPSDELTTTEEYQNYFEASLNFIRIADKKLSKQIFKHTRHILKRASLTAKSITIQKAYKTCLRFNQFEIFYHFLHESRN